MLQVVCCRKRALVLPSPCLFRSLIHSLCRSVFFAVSFLPSFSFSIYLSLCLSLCLFICLFISLSLIYLYSYPKLNSVNNTNIAFFCRTKRAKRKILLTSAREKDLRRSLVFRRGQSTTLSCPELLVRRRK